MYLTFLTSVDPDEPTAFRVENTPKALDAAIEEIGDLLGEVATLRVKLHGKDATSEAAQEIIDELIE
jgi:hypothetical protein